MYNNKKKKKKPYHHYTCPGPEFYKLSFNVLSFVTRTCFTKWRFKNMTELLQICPLFWVLSFEKLEMAPDNSLYHPPRYTAFEFQNSEHLPEAYTKYHENPIKKLSRLSSNDFVAQLIQKQINLILQNEKLFFFSNQAKLLKETCWLQLIFSPKGLLRSTVELVLKTKGTIRKNRETETLLPRYSPNPPIPRRLS